MKKSTIIILALIVAAGAAYFYFEGSPLPQDTSLQAQSASDADNLGSQVLSLLNQIRSLNIDSSLFKDPGYLTLRDYSVPIPTLGVGRSNPFAPLPGEAVAPKTK